MMEHLEGAILIHILLFVGSLYFIWREDQISKNWRFAQSLFALLLPALGPVFMIVISSILHLSYKRSAD